ncbi:hypothetical protein BC829DRAFT_420962 [Chytridium lagenaria]|nr:hypothetical protein BC829DRAFT_420962 [Chytridium lagenaria]
MSPSSTQPVKALGTSSPQELQAPIKTTPGISLLHHLWRRAWPFALFRKTVDFLIQFLKLLFWGFRQIWCMFDPYKQLNLEQSSKFEQFSEAMIGKKVGMAHGNFFGTAWFLTLYALTGKCQNLAVKLAIFEGWAKMEGLLLGSVLQMFFILQPAANLSWTHSMDLTDEAPPWTSLRISIFFGWFQ